MDGTSLEKNDGISIDSNQTCDKSMVLSGCVFVDMEKRPGWGRHVST